MNRQNFHIETGILTCLLIAGSVVLLYWSGLSGPFLLDDLPNLNKLARVPADPRWSDFWYLARSGLAGATGRPLALLTFLAQYQAWPDPFPFKLVNLLLHLLNGGLVAACCALLGRQCPGLRVSLPVIAFTVFLWLAHPLQLSTVLYVVQRMTELATTFVLLGICLYLEGRHRLATGTHRSGILLLLAGVLGCGLLAVFFKENGVLLLAYLAVLELTLLPAAAAGSAVYRWRQRALTAPLIIGVLAFMAYLPVALQEYALKSFSLGERLLTQFPVLLSYLGSAALLRPDSLGLYHDDFPLSTGLLQPWWTLPAILVVIGALLFAIRYRRRWPLLAFAVLWFLAGHALESTLLPLEVYFEHRNYLPLLGPVFALTVAVRRWLAQLPVSTRRLALVLVALVLVNLSLITWQQSRRWGEPLAFATAAVAAHPSSYRAQSNLMEVLAKAGHVETAFAYHLSQLNPGQPRIAQYLRWLQFNCLMPGLPLPKAQVLREQAAGSGHDYGALYLAITLTFAIVEERCQQPPLTQLGLVLATLLENPAYTTSRADLLQLQALLTARAGDFSGAAALAAASLASREDVLVALYRVGWLISAGETARAGRELTLIEENHGGAINASSALRSRVQVLQDQLARFDEL